MPNSEREVFNYFRNDPYTSTEVDALAYASFSFDKYEWMTKFEVIKGHAASEEDVNRWINELPDSRLKEIKANSLTLFQKSVAAYIQQAEKNAYQAGADHATVRRVEEATSFWRNLPGNIAVGIASSFAFALLLVAASLIFDKDPSPIALYHKVITQGGPPAVSK